MAYFGLTLEDEAFECVFFTPDNVDTRWRSHGCEYIQRQDTKRHSDVRD